MAGETLPSALARSGDHRLDPAQGAPPNSVKGGQADFLEVRSAAIDRRSISDLLKVEPPEKPAKGGTKKPRPPERASVTEARQRLEVPSPLPHHPQLRSRDIRHRHAQADNHKGGNRHDPEIHAHLWLRSLNGPAGITGCANELASRLRPSIALAAQLPAIRAERSVRCGSAYILPLYRCGALAPRRAPPCKNTAALTYCLLVRRCQRLAQVQRIQVQIFVGRST